MDPTFFVGDKNGEWITRLAAPCYNTEEERAVEISDYCLRNVANGHATTVPEALFCVEGFIGMSTRVFLNWAPYRVVFVFVSVYMCPAAGEIVSNTSFIFGVWKL